MKKIDLMPIKWFGDKNAYLNSDLKIITVGLNPSDKEFREKDNEEFSTQLRFSTYKGDDKTLEIALNNYFNDNPYRSWFNAFEPMLKGMDASYYKKNDIKNIALHTDICSHWATSPTWNNLNKQEKNSVINTKQWHDLVKELSPDIMLISVSQKHIDSTFLDTKEFWHSISKTKKGENRKEIYHVKKYSYNLEGKLIPVVFGKGAQKPFGSISNDQKLELGKILKDKLKK
jgi:hypothetical protein